MDAQSPREAYPWLNLSNVCLIWFIIRLPLNGLANKCPGQYISLVLEYYVDYESNFSCVVKYTSVSENLRLRVTENVYRKCYLRTSGRINPRTGIEAEMLLMLTVKKRADLNNAKSLPGNQYEIVYLSRCPVYQESTYACPNSTYINVRQML